tara:strand:- start:578 stop:895 length:318 start_codon:yes stop_codon:yes gene_type:complete
MKLHFPKKSILGFKVLNSIQSVLAAYMLLIIFYMAYPFFGNKIIELKAGSFFTLLANLSIYILILNSVHKKKNLKLFPWIIVNLPLWIYLPVSFNYVFNAIKIII